MEYQLDALAAKQADSVQSRIDTTGKYIGVFTRAEAVTSKYGTIGVEFSFKSNTGEVADYLSVWTKKGDNQLHGYKIFMSILACLKIRHTKAEVGEIEKWNYISKTREKVSVPLFKDLMNKEIGLLIQMEEYEKQDGTTAWKPSIYIAFSEDGFTSSEVLSQAIKPEKLEKIFQSLKDRPLKKSQENTADKASTSGFDSVLNMDDDIPF